MEMKLVDIEKEKAERDRKVRILLENMQDSVKREFPRGVPYDLQEQDIVVLSCIAQRGAYDAVGVVRLAYEYGMARGTKI